MERPKLAGIVLIRKRLQCVLVLKVFYRGSFLFANDVGFAHERSVLRSSEESERCNSLGIVPAIGVPVILVEPSVIEFTLDDPGQPQRAIAIRQ